MLVFSALFLNILSRSNAVILYEIWSPEDLSREIILSNSNLSEEPRFLFRPVRFGMENFNKRSFVSTALDRIRFAKGSSGCHDKPMDLLRSVDLSNY